MEYNINYFIIIYNIYILYIIITHSRGRHFAHVEGTKCCMLHVACCKIAPFAFPMLNVLQASSSNTLFLQASFCLCHRPSLTKSLHSFEPAICGF